MSERAAQLLGAGLGRLGDEGDIVLRDQAGTATRPLRVQRLHPEAVQVVDHLPHPVLGGLHQVGDHRHRVAASGRQHDERSAIPHHRRLTLAVTATDPSLQLAALLIGEPTDSHRFSHATSVANHVTPVVDPGVPVWSGH